MIFLNYTPHQINLNDGRSFESKGVARVASSHTEIVNDLCQVVYGDVEGLPEPQADTYYIVSAMVLGASNRSDLVAPASGHPECIRNDKGHIVSVPCFVRR